MRTPRTIATLALGLLALSCSVLTTFDGYVAGSPAADAGTDAGGVDATAHTDAAVQADAAAIADATPGRWCLTQMPSPMFCDDFDDQGPFANWSAVQQLNGATAFRDTNAFTSSPNSLVTETSGGAASSPAYLRLDSPGALTHVRFAFDYRIDTRDTQTGYAEVAYIHIGNTSDFYIRVYGDPTANGYTTESYVDGGIPVPHNVSFPTSVTFDTWRRISIDLDVGAAHAITLAVDGTSLMNQPLEPDLYPPGTMTVAPGYGYNGHPSGPWKMRFDNVTIDWN